MCKAGDVVIGRMRVLEAEPGQCKALQTAKSMLQCSNRGMDGMENRIQDPSKDGDDPAPDLWAMEIAESYHDGDQ